MVTPTIEQVAWVFRHLTDHLIEGGSFRYLIYDRMGFGPEAYEPLYKAGGLALSNALYTQCSLDKQIKTPYFNVLVDTDIPKGEAHLVDDSGKVVAKIVNLEDEENNNG